MEEQSTQCPRGLRSPRGPPSPNLSPLFIPSSHPHLISWTHLRNERNSWSPTKSLELINQSVRSVRKWQKRYSRSLSRTTMVKRRNTARKSWENSLPSLPHPGGVLSSHSLPKTTASIVLQAARFLCFSARDFGIRSLFVSPQPLYLRNANGGPTPRPRSQQTTVPLHREQ